MGTAPSSRTVTLFVTAALLLLTAALIFIPNRYWVSVSKKLAPPEEFRKSTRPDPWG
jgi:hypothetical protein